MVRGGLELKIVSLDRVYGPVSLEQLVRLAAEGRVCAQDLVRKAGAQTWHRVADVPAIAASLPQEPIRKSLAAGSDSVDLGLDADSGRITPRPRQQDEATMEMAPMIDVTFLLLIFFMLTNSLANPSPMDVPKAMHGRGVTLEGQQLILIDGQGKYYLGDNAAQDNLVESLDSLVVEVQNNASSSEAALDVIVSAHIQAKYSQIREMVERLGQLEGIGRVMIGVEEEVD